MNTCEDEKLTKAIVAIFLNTRPGRLISSKGEENQAQQFSTEFV